MTFWPSLWSFSVFTKFGYIISFTVPRAWMTTSKLIANYSISSNKIICGELPEQDKEHVLGKLGFLCTNDSLIDIFYSLKKNL
jgi:hypothetical protein